ncbi:MAG TPA: hypothetical protein VNJ01_11330 [Bacteriovoracaceae bacterium]|nr:hypothetical protein [Bacteriovoracaceae bacterium]
MKFLLFLIITSTSAFAQLRDECPQAGTLLSRELTGVTGEAQTNSFKRSGASDIPSTATLSGSINAKTFKSYKERHCVSKTHTYEQEVCTAVNVDLALGKGNAVYKSFYDLNITLLKRSQTFATNVAYRSGRSNAERIELASEVIKNITRIASVSSIPNNWADFTLMLKKIVEEGLLTQADFDDITTLNSEKNQKNLGFVPLSGVTVTEGKGNGKLNKIFDLGQSSQVRANLLKNLLVGISGDSTQALSASMIEFASSNGVPENWGQFVLMMKHALTTTAITVETFNRVTMIFEVDNRRNMGFELSAISCKMESRTQNVNVIVQSQKNEFLEMVRKTYQMSIFNAPLLPGEEETLNVVFDGVNNIFLNYSDAFNTFSIVSSTVVNGVEMITVQGQRKKINPRNNVFVQIVRQGRNINFRAQNPEFSPNVGGKYIVQVKFYERITLWPDRLIATENYELTSGELMTFNTNVQVKKEGRKAYLQVAVQVAGSNYFNDSLSGFKTIEQ